MRITSCVFAALFLILCTVAGQTPPAEARPGSISGMVVTSGGRAVPRATLILQSATPTDDPIIALSDEKGRFTFINVKPGSYNLTPQKTGYLAAPGKPSPGSQVQVPAGETVQGVSLMMIAAAVITGRVVDEIGEPAVGLQVLAFQRDTSGAGGAPAGASPAPQTEKGKILGVRDLPLGNARADDHGEFRIYGLPPGRYYVKAVGGSGSTPGKTYTDAFYPAAPPLEAAACLELKPGETMPANITMRLAAPVRAPAVAQQSPVAEANPSPASLSGKVVSSDGTPLAHAIVTLMTPPRQTTVTDDKGRFEFANLHAGSHMVVAEKTGYTGVKGYDYLMRQLAPGEHADDAVVKLFGLAAITGRVLDENGEPIEGISISAYPFEGATGKITRTLDGFFGSPLTTDDRGEFRIHSLTPGKYAVRAVSNHSPAGKLYPAIFYPATPSLEAASVFEIRPGDELPANFTMRPVKGVTVRGHVRAATGAKLSVTLQQRESDLIMMGNNFPLPSSLSITSNLKDDGTFELKNVPPGKYVVKGTFPPTREMPRDGRLYPAESRADVEVDKKDVDGVEIIPAEPLESVIIRGSVRCECPSGEKILTGGVGFSSPGKPFARSLRGFGMIPPLGKDLAFTIEALVGARVYLSGSASITSASGERVSAYVKSASLGDLDVAESEFTVTRGMAATPLEVVLSPSPWIDGIVLDSHDKPVANAHVMGLPEERFRHLLGSVRYLQAQTNPKGEFSMRFAIPGEYTMVAFQDDSAAGNFPPVEEIMKQHSSDGQVLKTEEKGHYKVVLHLLSLEAR